MTHRNSAENKKKGHASFAGSGYEGDDSSIICGSETENDTSVIKFKFPSQFHEKSSEIDDTDEDKDFQPPAGKITESSTGTSLKL